LRNAINNVWKSWKKRHKERHRRDRPTRHNTTRQFITVLTACSVTLLTFCTSYKTNYNKIKYKINLNKWEKGKSLIFFGASRPHSFRISEMCKIPASPPPSTLRSWRCNANSTKEQMSCHVARRRLKAAASEWHGVFNCIDRLSNCLVDRIEPRILLLWCGYWPRIATELWQLALPNLGCRHPMGVRRKSRGC